jgi:phosphatidate cytidylyltransferase
MAGTFVQVSTLDVIASFGGALAVAGLAYRLARPGSGGDVPRSGAASRDGAASAAIIGATGAFWLGGDALIVLFAVVSALALADFMARDAIQGDSVQTAFCYACVPLQFGALASGRLDLALVLLPLVAALALPLLTLVQSGPAHLVERTSERFWAVMAWVYCVSHVPALLLLDGPAFEARNASLVAFVVAVALAGQALGSWRGAATRPRLWAAHMVALTALGAALAWMTPFAVPIAAALALATALAGWAGMLVLRMMRHDRVANCAQRAGVLERIAFRPDTLVFAAPVFFHCVSFALAW